MIVTVQIPTQKCLNADQIMNNMHNYEQILTVIQRSIRFWGQNEVKKEGYLNSYIEENETLVTANGKHYRVVEGLRMTIFRP